MASQFWSTRRTFLRVILLLNICLTTSCNGILDKNMGISVNEIRARPQVQIPQGTLRGLNTITHHGRNVFEFKGIPFAQPPVGNLRFEGPLPPDSWDGILDAGRDSSHCPQMENNKFIGDEDCLYLNVYTPRLPVSENSTLLPVIFWVFGGRYKSGHSGSSRWGPYFILDKDVVLVVPSYRLGVLGCFSTGDEVSPGNYGLKDLLRALEWNRDNVKYFGGDPNQVTLSGSSSGSTYVELLTLSNLTDGLFERCITNSGSSSSYSAQQPRRLLSSHSTRLGEYFGCPTDTSTSLVNCLRSVNASQLVDTESLFHTWHMFPQVTWGPTVEPDMEGAFMTDSAASLIDAGKICGLPRMVNVNRNEGIVFSANFFRKPDLFERFLDEIDVALPAILQYDGMVDDVHAMTTALKSYYLNDLTANRTLLMLNFTQLVGDAHFVYHTYRTIQQQLVHSKSPNYFSVFGYRGTFSYSYYFSGGSLEDYGVSHADDLIYLFQNSEFPLGPPGSEMNDADLEMVDTMVQLLTSFAINGIPTTADPNTTVIWEPYSSRKNYLRIGNNSDTSIGIGYNFSGDQMQVWEELTALISRTPF